MKARVLGMWIGLVLFAAPAMPAAAAVDMTGRWYVTLLAGPPFNPEEYLWDIVQVAGALSVSLEGSPIHTGTVDPDTGEFDLTEVPSGSCPGGSIFGTANQDNKTFFGLGITQYYFKGMCFTVEYGVVASRCGNQQIDADEQCDDGNSRNDDCCSSTCQLDGAGSPCASADLNPCIDGTCDGAGTCTTFNTTAPCNDGLFCNGTDTCNGNGACSHTGNPCLFGPECADTCDEIDNLCKGPTGTACATDDNACTLDVCGVGGSGGFCDHTPLPAGTQGDCELCTACDETGNCADMPIPDGVCKTPTVPLSAILQISNSTPSTSDRLLWKWRKGAVTEPSEFGQPTFRDDYALCVFDESGATPSLLLRADIPKGETCGTKPCWRTLGSGRGFAYRDSETTPHGIRAMKLRSGGDGKAQMTVLGKGDNLMLGAPADLPLPLRVQLQTTHGTCWEATFDSALVNAGGIFKAKGD